MTCTGVAQSGYILRSECAAQRDVAMTAVARRNTAPSSCTFGRYDARSIADVASCPTHSCVQSIDTTDGIRRIRSRLAYAVACRWKWMTSNGSCPAALIRRRASRPACSSCRKRARSRFLMPNAPSIHTRWQSARRTARSNSDRSSVRTMCRPSMADWCGRYSRRKWWKEASPRMPPLTNSTRITVETPNLQLPTPKLRASYQLGESRRDFHPQTIWELGIGFWELSTEVALRPDSFAQPLRRSELNPRRRALRGRSGGCGAAGRAGPCCRRRPGWRRTRPA